MRYSESDLCYGFIMGHISGGTWDSYTSDLLDNMPYFLKNEDGSLKPNVRGAINYTHTLSNGVLCLPSKIDYKFTIRALNNYFKKAEIESGGLFNESWVNCVGCKYSIYKGLTEIYPCK